MVVQDGDNAGAGQNLKLIPWSNVAMSLQLDTALVVATREDF
jgi:myo-inositol-hexaphosphate 3-phosphohydrolase